jgi:hypothetical protein
MDSFARVWRVMEMKVSCPETLLTNFNSESLFPGFPYLYDHDWFRFQDKVITEISSAKDLQEEFKKNSELLKNTRDDMRSWECLEMMMKNMYLLVLIAKSEPFIFKGLK